MLLVSTFWQVTIFTVLVGPLVLAWLFAIADIWRRRYLSRTAKTVWFVFMVLIPLLTPLVYFVYRISWPTDEFRA